MKFDKSRVYTAVNADELRVGSKCIFADSLATLKACVETENPRIRILEEIEKENYTNRFIWNDSYNCYHMNLAYLIEPPAEPKYKPFESVEKAMDAIMKHGGWVKRLGFEYYYLIKGCCSDGRGLNIYTDVIPYSAESFFCSFIFADDGSPCGELVEEK